MEADGEAYDEGRIYMINDSSRFEMCFFASWVDKWEGGGLASSCCSLGWEFIEH